MKRTTTIGKMYAVTSAAGCTVTTPDGLPICTVEAGTQGYFTAPTSTVEVDDDAALLTETFKRAASVLGLLGGGVTNELPAGYLRAEFLENGSKRAYIITDFVIDADFGAKCSFEQQPTTNGTTYLIGSYRPYFVAPRFTHASVITGGFSDGKVIRLNGVQERTGRHISQLNYKNSKVLAFDEFELLLTELNDFSGYDKLGVFAYNGSLNAASPSISGTRIFNISFSRKTAEVGHFIPAVNPQGKACFFDTITKTPFSSSTDSKFLAGFTLAQARQLGAHLPASGGELTISLPTGYEQDAAVDESLETARAKGWTLTLQTYDAEAAAATFGMRRVWVRRVQDEQGGYVDADGVRWAVDWCVDMLTPDGSTPDLHGYELYRSTEAAVAYWELQAYVDPEAEELLTTESL